MTCRTNIALTAGSSVCATCVHTFKKLSHGVYSITAIADYCAFLREAVRGNGAGAGLTQERSELTKERVKMARLERKKLQKLLIPADQIAPGFDEYRSTIRSQMLSLPAIAGSRFGRCRNPAELTIMLRAEIDARLNACRDTKVFLRGKEVLPDLGDGYDDDDDADADDDSQGEPSQ